MVTVFLNTGTRLEFPKGEKVGNLGYPGSSGGSGTMTVLSDKGEIIAQFGFNAVMGYVVGEDAYRQAGTNDPPAPVTTAHGSGNFSLVE